MSGCYDGSVALWSQMKKKPICLHRAAHVKNASDGAGSVDEACAGWVQSVAVCPGGDLVVRLSSVRLVELNFRPLATVELAASDVALLRAMCRSTGLCVHTAALCVCYNGDTA